uniref:Short transient receptor potential channel 2 n=1 Tax=Petromyzon marinus TaxID=7757 RepID=A0AAJ7UBW5_PETMA|nr:short transient receptor potential channel 2 [Petromyzon marinus]
MLMLLLLPLAPPTPVSPEQHARSWRNIVSRKVRFPIALQAAIRDGNVARVYDILGAAETGGGVTAERGGAPNPRQADEQEDRSWREALNLAIRMGSDEVLGALLRCVRFDFRQIHEALLVAVDTNQQQVVTLLLDRLDNDKALGHNKMDIRSFSLAIFDHSMDSSRYPPGVTPLTLASQDNLFDIVEVLLKKGHAIQRPHNISCGCLECQNGRQYDTLKFSLSRINTYRGLAGRPYLCLASGDAILGAFELSRELTRLARQEPEFKAEYMELDRQCEEFAVELLAMCQNQREVDSLLNDAPPHGDEELAHGAFEEGIPSLGRLRLAVSHHQKLFVSHPVCQQVLTSIWCSGMPSWRGSHAAVKAGTCLGIFLGMPVLALIYWIAPKSRLGNLLRTPLLKFLMHSASYLWFLFFLLVESIMMDSSSDIVSTRNQTLMDNSFHMVWVAGFLWYECKEVWIEGLCVYLSDWWNCLDLAMISMYISSFTLRLLVRWSGELACGRDPLSAECAYFTTAERGQWQKDDPQIIAEVVFAITSALSFTRLAFILPAHESLGTLQISIGKILGDIFRFMFLVMIIGTAFLCGINNLYVHYTFNKLGRFNETFQYLFWTVFGMEDRRTTDIPNFEIAQFVGRSLYGVYAIIMAIVLLNMLIAMITSSFERIEDDADVEWKFARSRLYLSYFREGLTLPVPFNLIPSPKSVYYAIMRTAGLLFCRTSQGPSSPSVPSISEVIMNTGVHDGWGLVEPRGARQSQVIRTLVRRYIDKARQEYEENKHKDLGFRVGELTKSVARMHGDIKSIRRSLSRARLGLPEFAVSPGQARSDGDTASYLHATSDGESPCSSASASQRGSFRFVVHEPDSPAQHRSGPAHDDAQHPRPVQRGGDSQRLGPVHTPRALPSQQLGSRSPVSDCLRIGASDGHGASEVPGAPRVGGVDLGGGPSAVGNRPTSVAERATPNAADDAHGLERKPSLFDGRSGGRKGSGDDTAVAPVEGGGGGGDDEANAHCTHASTARPDAAAGGTVGGNMGVATGVGRIRGAEESDDYTAL